MESTELSFMDQKHGGAFPENLLPEMTMLSEEGEDFSGEDGSRNGGISLPGATWTMGAIFAQSTGLPLKISIEQNSMDSQKAFFPSVVSIQDILEEEGYTQKFLLGSVGYFGGRELFMKDHGDVQVEDFSYWKKQNKFPRDYWVNWGFEDEKLYTYAKEELLSLAKENQPFNLTLLTVDTHFPDGYVCRLCQNTYPDNQYANVFRCASRQVTDFVNWIKEQDFYENTTIVISGDHPTMDRDFCEDVPKSYQRKVYTVFLNSATKSSDVIFSSNSNTLVFNESDSNFLIAPFSYEISAGFDPILTIPRVGIYPLSSESISEISSFNFWAVSAPYNKITKAPPILLYI